MRLKPTIIYEDTHLMVINKPCGLNADTDRAGHASVEAWLKQYFYNKKHVQPVLMHRLDRVTSGLLLISKKPSTTKKLQLAFEQHKIEKKYLAVVHHCSLQKYGTLKHFLKKDVIQKKSLIVNSSDLGKHAELNYKLLAHSDDYSLLEIDLKTGRFHQIRAQLAASGCPIVGDIFYGSKVESGIEEGIALHAYSLRIKYPIHEIKQEWKAFPEPRGVWQLFTDFMIKFFRI